MKVFISFATEDFVTPGHDEILIRLASILNDREITGSFHVTGEVVRKWRRHHCREVIEALSRHEIGYHSNTHGAFPFIGRVASELPWDEAVGTLLETESRGIGDIEAVFGCKPAYYVTEFIKAPQLIQAMVKLGVDVMGFSELPEGKHSFRRFMGAWCFAAPHIGLESPPHPGRFAEMTAAFDQVYEREIPLLKLFNHPYKFLYNNKIASWISENRIYRKYDHDWKTPGKSMYDRSTVEGLLRELEAFLDYVKSRKNIEFVNTAEAVSQYRVALPLYVNRDILSGVGEAIAPLGDFTPAEVFGLLIGAVTRETEELPFRRLIGPVEPSPELTQAVTLPLEKILPALRAVDREMDFTSQMPSAISDIPPGALWRGMISYLKAPGKTITFTPGPELPEEAAEPYFAAETWMKKSYPEHFTGEKICEACRRQSWTLN